VTHPGEGEPRPDEAASEPLPEQPPTPASEPSGASPRLTRATPYSSLSNARPRGGAPSGDSPGPSTTGDAGRPSGETVPDEAPPGAPPPRRPSANTPPLYRGEPLDAARGPGLGCFWLQLILLVTLLIVTPIGVANSWPNLLTAGLLILTLVLLLFAGQTVIFLLRIVAADRRTPRRPLGAGTPTVGQLEDAEEAGASTAAAKASAMAEDVPGTAEDVPAPPRAEEPPSSVRQ
jgi:hypothetical protein